MSTVWIENTTSKYDHGGCGWEFGVCIWSPARDRRGAVGKYRIMQQVQIGDRVINCCDGKIRGTSRVATICDSTSDRPPNPGPWSYANSFFRFNLTDFNELADPIELREIIAKHKAEIEVDIENNRPKYFLFSLYPRSEFYPEGKVVLGQGRFLATTTPCLQAILRSYFEF